MPKRPSRPGFPAVIGDAESSGKHRVCGVGRAALARTEQLMQRLDDHVADDVDQLAALSRDVDAQRVEIRTVNNHVSDLRVDVAKMSSVVDNINETIAQQNEIKHVRLIAEVETGKVEKVAAIEDEVDRKKARRALLLKVAVAIVTGFGAALGMIIEHYR
jgi:hypothetical protein